MPASAIPASDDKRLNPRDSSAFSEPPPTQGATPAAAPTASDDGLLDSSGPTAPARLSVPRDGNGVLAMLRAPPPPWTLYDVVLLVCDRKLDHLVRRAIEKGVVLSEGQPGLVNAVAAKGSVPLLRYLISERGLDPNQQDANHNTPLHAALGGGTDRNALYLINDAGADVNASSSQGLTPLMLAAGKGFVEVLKALVAKGADVGITTTGGMTALGYAVEGKQMEAALYLLQEAGAAWDRPDPTCLLVTAAKAGLFSFLKPLLRHMRSKEVAHGDIAHYLAEAASDAIGAGSPGACLKAFAKEGLDLKTARLNIDNHMIPLLHAMCTCDRLDVVNFLLQKGCDPKEPDEKFGFLPQHVAAAHGYLHLVRVLLRVASIDVNAITTKEPFGAMLHIAAEQGHMDAVQWLIGQSADVRLLSGGESPARASAFAEASGHTAVAAYLREQEQAADARERAEEAAAAEAEVGRERNERRRQKKKKKKAAMTGLSTGVTAAGGEEVGTEATMDPEEEAMLQAAIALSLSVEHPPLEAVAASPLPVVARPPPLEEYMETNAPDGMLCPISIALLDDPVVLAADGITYSRAAIEQHLEFCRQRSKPLSSPSTNMVITDPALTMLVPNVFVRGLVLDYRAAKEREWAGAERLWQEAMGGKGAK